MVSDLKWHPIRLLAQGRLAAAGTSSTVGRTVPVSPADSNTAIRFWWWTEVCEARESGGSQAWSAVTVARTLRVRPGVHALSAHNAHAATPRCTVPARALAAPAGVRHHPPRCLDPTAPSRYSDTAGSLQVLSRDSDGSGQTREKFFFKAGSRVGWGGGAWTTHGQSPCDFRPDAMAGAGNEHRPARMSHWEGAPPTLRFGPC